MAAKEVKKKRRGRNGIYVLLTVLLTLIAVIVGIGLFFRVSTIDVAGGEVYSHDEIVKMSDIKTGENMLLLNEKEIAEKITSKLIYINDVKLIRSYPDMVILEVYEDAPIATTKSGGTTWLINASGKLFQAESSSKANGLIRLVGADLQEPESGKTAVTAGGETQVECITEFLTAVRKNGVEEKIGTVDVTNIGSISFDYDGRFKVNLGSQGEIGNKVDMLVEAIENKIEQDAAGRLEFTTDVELHFVPES